jgi:hypothetical protein
MESLVWQNGETLLGGVSSLRKAVTLTESFSIPQTGERG